MRADGSVIGAGDPNQDGLGLPMEEREDRHEVRARHEAKRGRTSSPWAGREAPAPGTKEQKAARNARSHDPAREQELFEPKPFPAAPDPAPAPPPKVSPGPNAASIVQDYVDGVSIRTIAMKRKLKIAVVRETLLATTGLALRSEDATPPAKRDDAPELVEAVRRLYQTEGLTQQEIAARLNLTPGKVKGLMTRHAIPGRRSGPRVDPPRSEPVVDQAAPAPAVANFPPVAMPTPEQPPIPQVAMPTLDVPPRRELTPEQQQVVEAFARAFGDALGAFARGLVETAQQFMTGLAEIPGDLAATLAAPQAVTQDDYTLAGDPE